MNDDKYSTNEHDEDEVICCYCGNAVDPGDAYTIEGQIYCEDCCESNFTVCDNCNCYVRPDEVESDQDDTQICASCYMSEYTRCDRCERIIHDSDVYRLNDDDDCVYCSSCYEELEKTVPIHNYSYKPTPVFYDRAAHHNEIKDTRYLGVELEVDSDEYIGDYYQEEIANNILDIANRGLDHEKRLYIKHDGSLNHGFEAVSHPMTLDYHLNTMPWKEIMSELIASGYLSHSVRTCGLHVHVNRRAFGSNIDEEDTNIAHLLYLVEHHWHRMLRFSRRTQRQIEQWAARYAPRNEPKDFKDDVKSTGNYRRYMCINLTNEDTVEFRLFRGTLRYNTFRATLQFVNVLCDLAVGLTDEEIKELTWENLVLGIDKDKYPELIEYLKERKLYTTD